MFRGSTRRAIGEKGRRFWGPQVIGHCEGFGFSWREMGSHSWVFSHDLVYILPGFTLAAALRIENRDGEQESKETRLEVVVKMVRSQILDRS